MALAHAAPALEIGELLERDEDLPSVGLRQRIEFRPIHQGEPRPYRVAHESDAGPEELRFVLVVQQHTPQRQPALADSGPGLDLGAQALRARAVEVADRGLGETLGKGIVRGGQAER